MTDAQLEAAIRAKFAKSKIHEDKFTVRVQGGVAHIDGKTDVLQHKGVATRMAKTAGAAMVDNRIQVSQAAKDKAAGNLAQGRRRAQVKRGDPRSRRPPAEMTENASAPRPERVHSGCSTTKEFRRKETT